MDELTNEQTGDEWEKEYRGISVKYEKSWVRIVCDQILKDYLGEEGNGSLALADYALGRYKEKFGCELNIKRHSLAVEILAHVYADKFAGSMLDMKKGLAPTELQAMEAKREEIKAHTGIIDCGEKSVDSNRVVWDNLEPLHGIIYAVMGKHA